MNALALALALFTGTVAAQPTDFESVPYTVLTAAGDTVSLGDVVAAMRDADVVFLGEMHDDSTAHVVQRRLFEAANTFGRPLALGLEMFERDVQPVLDEYLAGLIRERDFLAAARPWKNYATDYRPLVEFAREHGHPVLATNAPGRYVNRTSRLGLEALAELSAGAKATLPPLPFATASDTLAAKFTAMMEGMMAHGHGDPAADSSAMAVHGSAPSLDNLLAAQNLRDATMAWSISRYLAAHRGSLVVHVNGSFHSEGRLGIPEHLARYHPGARVLIVTLHPEAAAPVGTEDDFVVLARMKGN